MKLQKKHEQQLLRVAVVSRHVFQVDLLLEIVLGRGVCRAAQLSSRNDFFERKHPSIFHNP